MAFRVTIDTGPNETTIRIEGQLTAATSPDMTEACERARPPLRLDLTGLRSADDAGTRALLSLSEAGAELHGANPYIRELLHEADK